MIGVVIIGRNEGDRLRQAILSVNQANAKIVYVDSGSADGSVQLAQQLQCDVVELDMTRPFTAGRGRNAGFHFLIENYPKIEYVQFIDGDCTIDPSWLEKAIEKITSDPTIAAVCGRRRERYPDASIYNLLCDMEWNTSIGIATECGGDALMRVNAFQQLNGFDESFAAGEEPELCYRFRQAGWKIWRIDAEMTLHDANMTTFQQWWKRNVRSGSAFAQCAWHHGREPEHFYLRDSIRIWQWGLIVPLLALLLIPWTLGLSLFLFLGYPILTQKIYRYRIAHFGDRPKDGMLYSIFCVLGKFPQLEGQIRFLSVRQSRLIEYKGV